MGLFDFFKKKSTDKVEAPINSTEQNPSFEELNDIIEKEIQIGDFGGATPTLTLRKSGYVYLIVECPPFLDGDGNDIDGDADFPEGDEFEKLISEYTGVKVDRDDREVFIIQKSKEDTLDKVKFFLENYWSLRKEIYKTK